MWENKFVHYIFLLVNERVLFTHQITENHYLSVNRDTQWRGLSTFLPSDQIRSVAQSCPALCDSMNRSTPGLPVHHQLPEFTHTHVHQVSDAIQPSHPLLSPSPPAPNPSQHQSLFQWVNSSFSKSFAKFSSNVH